MGTATGTRNGNARYPDSVVLEARRWQTEGLGAEDIAYIMRLPPQTVRDWIKGITRKTAGHGEQDQ